MAEPQHHPEPDRAEAEWQQPDWLVRVGDEETPAGGARPASPAPAAPMLRRPGSDAPGVPRGPSVGPRPAHLDQTAPVAKAPSAPKAVAEVGTAPPSPTPAPGPGASRVPVAARLDGLVGTEVPAAAPRPALPARDEQLGVDHGTLAHGVARRVAESPAPGSAAARAPEVAPAPGLVSQAIKAGRSAEEIDIEPAMPATWSAAASSIPAIRSSVRRATELDAGEDDAWGDEDGFETARASASGAAAVPPVPRTARPVRAAGGAPPWAGAALGVARRAWAWSRANRRIAGWAASALVAVVSALVAAIPRGEPAMPLRAILDDAAALDGARVRVAGVVGQTFPVGEGHAFYLHQGRDTIVVFTRRRTPATDERIELEASVSTGYLAGRPRPALFEVEPTP